MKYKMSFFFILMCSFVELHAQQFITKAVIEYEVKSNVKKTMLNFFMNDELKDQIPTFKTGYYNFSFAHGESIFKFDHWSDDSKKVPNFIKSDDELNAWYANYNTNKMVMQKAMWGSQLIVQDSIRKLEWRITNESRVIAGFNCRKAVTIMFDSVYVFAFYTDEIMISGGPCSINGLPGMILGVTIPRLYTSWIATKVMISGIDEKDIKQISTKKPLTIQDLKATIIDHTKDWYSDDEMINKEIKQHKTTILWQTLL